MKKIALVLTIMLTLLFITSHAYALIEILEDVNDDNVVDSDDIAVVSSNYGTENYDCDINSDNIVNLYDLVLVGKRMDIHTNKLWASDLDDNQILYSDANWQAKFQVHTYVDNYGNQTIKNLVKISYRNDVNEQWDQYVSIDLDSSYIRAVDSTETAWGASFIILPTVWISASPNDLLYQGGEMGVYCTGNDDGLVVYFEGRINESSNNILRTHGSVIISMENNSLDMTVSEYIDSCGLTEGTYNLSSSKSDEAFQFVKVSTMSVTNQYGLEQQDSTRVFADQNFTIDSTYNSSGEYGHFFISPRLIGNMPLTVVGCSEKWDDTTKPAPSYGFDIHYPAASRLSGWYTHTNNPNDDNIAVWLATDDGDLLSSWKYDVSVFVYDEQY